MGAVVHLAQQGDFTGRQLDLIRRTVATDCNEPEFDLFCEVARRHQLDPFRKQISVIVFSKDNPDKRRMAIITGIDGLRSIAARSLRYRPDEEEPEYEYEAEAKDPLTNPLGLIKARVRIYIRDEGGDSWRPVTGVAYWDEFAPVKEEWAWREDEGGRRSRKPTGKMTLEGTWLRMGRVMLAKCAEAQALRKAFPEDLSGLYAGEEMDQARAAEMSASEVIASHREDERLRRVGAANSIMAQLTPASPLEAIPLGQFADRVLEVARDFDLQQFRWFEAANTHPLREFWARSPSDALALKAEMEKLGARLADQ